MAPILLGLRANLRIAINFTRGRLKNPAIQSLGQAQHIDGTVHARLGGLDRITLVVDWRGRTSQIVNLVNLHIERERDIVADQLKMHIVMQVIDIGLGASIKIVDTNNIISKRNELVDQVRPKKTGAARYEDLLAVNRFGHTVSLL